MTLLLFLSRSADDVMQCCVPEATQMYHAGPGISGESRRAEKSSSRQALLNTETSWITRWAVHVYVCQSHGSLSQSGIYVPHQDNPEHDIEYQTPNTKHKHDCSEHEKQR